MSMRLFLWLYSVDSSAGVGMSKVVSCICRAQLQFLECLGALAGAQCLFIGLLSRAARLLYSLESRSISCHASWALHQKLPVICATLCSLFFISNSKKLIYPAILVKENDLSCHIQKENMAGKTVWSTKEEKVCWYYLCRKSITVVLRYGYENSTVHCQKEELKEVKAVRTLST